MEASPTQKNNVPTSIQPISSSRWSLQREKDLLKILASLILIVGTPAFFSLLQRSSDLSSTSGLSVGANQSNIARSPASFESRAAQTSVRSSLLNLDCGPGLQSVTTDSSSLRLAGSLCDPKSGAYQIRNETNGYTASVIQTPDSRFTTDFIDLSLGKNVISIKDVGSLQTRQVQVVREPAQVRNSNL